MKFKSRTDEKVLDDIKSAGKNYLALYIEEILLHADELEDSIFKNRLIEKQYREQVGFYDKDSSGTRTRINSVLRIIQANKIIYALEQINESDPRITDEAIREARNIINKINAGEIRLPRLV